MVDESHSKGCENQGRSVKIPRIPAHVEVGTKGTIIHAFASVTVDSAIRLHNSVVTSKLEFTSRVSHLPLYHTKIQSKNNEKTANVK